MYPRSPIGAGLKETVNRYFDPETSRFKTQFEVDEEDAAVAKAELEATYEQPYFTFNEAYLTPDLYGDKYMKCPYAEPCPEGAPPTAADLVQLNT